MIELLIEKLGTMLGYAIIITIIVALIALIVTAFSYSVTVLYRLRWWLVILCFLIIGEIGYERYQLTQTPSFEDTLLDEHTPSSERNAIIQDFMLAYALAMVEAINSQDYEQVRPFIQQQSVLEESQMRLIASLAEQNITEEVVAITVEDIEPLDAFQYRVRVNEQITVFEDGQSRLTDFTWQYYMNTFNGSPELTMIE
ncbi:hypothetical protein GCM10007425_05160 [Lysinibacillus alkalisoli]|uniref:TcaA protein NTF2-like domain-containing protein n=1 Tax=Lysinibacillus alkalisoli TaxID=1911548 RepID=A0A917FY54_9BACI|nr:hypothetical protein [Lysinibacillus alkalisoli]GGG13830.1 hypothetical protein GCM10007425_05160 [Lysinibacillus alkalisoli]